MAPLDGLLLAKLFVAVYDSVFLLYLIMIMIEIYPVDAV